MPYGGTAGSGSDLSQAFRHRGWHRARTLVDASLRRTHQSVSRITAFQACGHGSYVYRTVDPPHKYRLGGSSCRDRFCIPCANDRSRVLAHNALAALGTEPVRFLTLTLKHSDEPLAAQLDRLYRCFSKLRQRSFWKRKVRGGAAFLETTWSDKSHAWHPHLHCLVHGKYLDRSPLSALWLQVTGDSMVIDVRLIRDRLVIARYVTKYVSKPLNNTFVNRPPLLDELVTATRRRRLCITFGDWRGIQLTADTSDREWESIGSFYHVCHEARRGDPFALEALRQICPGHEQHAIDALPIARPPPESPSHHRGQSVLQWDAFA